MRTAARIAIALGVVVVLGLAALAVLLPRIASSPAVRTRIEGAAREAIGREVRFAELDVGLLPPRLVVGRPEVAGEDGDAPPLLVADEVGLRLELLPLLMGAVLVDQIVVEGATLRLDRTDRGIVLPPLGRAPEDATRAGEGEPAPAPAGEGGGLTLAVREALVRDGRLIVTDRTLRPAAVFELADIDASTRLEALDAPIPFELSADLASGGTLRARGTATAGGAVEARLDLDGVSVAPAAPYVAADGAALAGSLGGRIDVSGAIPGAAQILADLALRDADIVFGDVILRGGVDVRAELDGPAAALGGTFDADATAAELVYGAGFKKPRGTPATATGRIVPQQGGIPELKLERVKIHNLEAEGALRVAPRPSLTLRAAPFEAQGWERLVPALESYALAGPIAIPELSVAAEPLEVRGRVELDGLRATLPDAGAVVARGRVEGQGDGVRTRDLAVEIAGQRVEIDGRVSELAGTPRYAARVRTARAETNALLSELTEVDDTLYGPLDLDVSLSGPLAADSLLDAVSGEARLSIACLQGAGEAEADECRLRGVSLLRSVLERLGPIGQAALAAGRASGSRTIERFYGDVFRSITGTFRVSGGRARTDDLRLVYRGYTVDLRGSVGLADLSLDATGKLTIEEELDEQVAAAAGREAAVGRRRVIPLASVTGTLQSPRVDLSPDAVTRFAASYAVEQRRGELTRKLDEELGEGRGKEVIELGEDLLEGILGGKK